MTGVIADTAIARSMIAAARAEADVYDAKIRAIAASPRATTIEGNMQITENVVLWAQQREYYRGLADMTEFLITGKDTAGIAAVAKRVMAVGF